MIEDTVRRIEAIEARNRRVEAEKAWETSWSRRGVLAILTYATIVLFFLVAGLPRPFLNPIVPTIGFLLSTLTISSLKDSWLRSRRQEPHA